MYGVVLPLTLTILCSCPGQQAETGLLMMVIRLAQVPGQPRAQQLRAFLGTLDGNPAGCWGVRDAPLCGLSRRWGTPSWTAADSVDEVIHVDIPSSAPCRHVFAVDRVGQVMQGRFGHLRQDTPAWFVIPEWPCVTGSGRGSGAGRDGRHPGVSGEGVADGGEDGGPVLGGGGGVSADGVRSRVVSPSRGGRRSSAGSSRAAGRVRPGWRSAGWPCRTGTAARRPRGA